MNNMNTIPDSMNNVNTIPDSMNEANTICRSSQNDIYNLRKEYKIGIDGGEDIYYLDLSDDVVFGLTDDDSDHFANEDDCDGQIYIDWNIDEFQSEPKPTISYKEKKSVRYQIILRKLGRSNVAKKNQQYLEQIVSYTMANNLELFDGNQLNNTLLTNYFDTSIGLFKQDISEVVKKIPEFIAIDLFKLTLYILYLIRLFGSEEQFDRFYQSFSENQPIAKINSFEFLVTDILAIDKKFGTTGVIKDL